MGTFWSNTDGLKVHFGERYSGEQAVAGEAAGPSGNRKTLCVLINARDFTINSATYNGPTWVLPAGVVIKSVTAEVITAFGALQGTTPTLNVGTSGSAPANHAAQFSAAQVTAVAPLDLTSTILGTFAAATPLLVATTVTVELGGTAPKVHATITTGTIQVMIAYEDPLGVAG